MAHSDACGPASTSFPLADMIEAASNPAASTSHYGVVVNGSKLFVKARATGAHRTVAPGVLIEDLRCSKTTNPDDGARGR
jgi:hypothetical protein